MGASPDAALYRPVPRMHLSRCCLVLLCHPTHCEVKGEVGVELPQVSPLVTLLCLFYPTCGVLHEVNIAELLNLASPGQVVLLTENCKLHTSPSKAPLIGLFVLMQMSSWKT